MRWSLVLFVCMLMLVFGNAAHAQTATPEPTLTATPSETPLPTATPTPEPFVYATVVPEGTAEQGQMTRFDYVASAGDVHIANMLTLIFFSMWGMFLFTIVVLAVMRRK